VSRIPQLVNPAADRGGDIATAAWFAFCHKAKSFTEAERIRREHPAALRLFDDRGIVAKADQTVGTTTVSGWASQLTQSVVGRYFSALGPQSAATQLIKASGGTVDLGAASSIAFPRLSSAPATVAWSGEGDPTPVDEETFASDTLGPQKKFGVITVLSRELAKRAAGMGVIDAVLRERAALSIDAAIFSAAATDSVTHRGILDGVTATTGHSECEPDVTTLLKALGDKGGSGNAAIVCSAANAAEIAVKLPNLKYPVWPSRAVGNTVIALDPTAFVIAFGGVDIEASESGTLHMSDVPLEIVSGTGPATADPARALFQTATIAVRMLVDVAFVQRNDLVCFMEDISWA
jgi:hypothetical protein